MLWVGEHLRVPLAGAGGCGEREEKDQEGSRKPGHGEEGTMSAVESGGNVWLVLLLKV